MRATPGKRVEGMFDSTKERKDNLLEREDIWTCIQDWVPQYYVWWSSYLDPIDRYIIPASAKGRIRGRKWGKSVMESCQNHGAVGVLSWSNRINHFGD